MPLLRIEVCDFKSYRGHQTIGPFQNFTSVIGPNGAGKSNLMDAISFVLGVKSTQLRSSQLKDLVYRGRRLARDENLVEGGSETQNGDEDEVDEGEGTAKKAWVLAVFEDVAKKEWRFQRTISVSGASEYKLNGKVVTYTAYNATLISHNILVKAKNFLVFQGDVEAVASQSPKDLSRLIEQISGSLELAGEYEKAKEDQDTATENATVNFTKRRGIAGEIKQYKEQKSEAERFEGLCQERDGMVLHRILFKLFHIEESIEQNLREISSQNKALAGLRGAHRLHADKLSAARADQAKARSTLAQKERQIKKAEKTRSEKDPAVAAIEAQIKHSERKKVNAEKSQAEVQRNVDALQQKVIELEQERNDVCMTATAVQEAQRKATGSNISLGQENLEEYRRLKASASTRAVGEKQALESHSRDERTATRLLSQLQEKQRTEKEKQEQLQAELEVAKDDKKKLDIRHQKLSQDLKEAKQSLDKQVSERKRIAQLETQANEQLADVQNKLLQAGLDRNETEKEVKMKETMNTLQRLFPGVRGRVVDLCKPTQRKYETAVAVVLGRNIEAIVVDEEKTAIDCIDYMRNQRAGHATFIPLDTIQVKPINDRFRSFAKGARLAIDVIQYEPAVERAIHHACGNALVCDTMDIARHVSYERGQEVKAVTLEGTIIHKSGLITGGRSTHSNNKKWDEKDVQGLLKTRDKLLADLRELSKQRPRDSDGQYSTEISRLDSLISEIKDDLSGINLKIKGKQGELKHNEQELKKIAPELQKAQNNLDSIKSEMAALTGKIDEEETDIFASFCQRIGISHIREFEDRQLKLVQEEREAMLRFENQIARLNHQYDFEEEQRKLAQERHANYAQLLRDENKMLDQLYQRLEAAKEEISQMDMQLKTLKVQETAAQEDMNDKTKKLDEIKKETSKAQKDLDVAIKEIATRNDENEKLGAERSALYRKCRVDEVQLPLLHGNLKNVPMEENFTEDMAVDVDEDDNTTAHRARKVPDYGIEVDFQSVEDDERLDGTSGKMAGLDSAIAKINEEIESMAPNMKAMKRLDDVEAKLAQTEHETEKARKESKAARDHFSEVKKKRCELFNKAYNHISERIDQVYKDLTKGKASPLGGVAYLSLEDNEEPYAAGIKYHAMPPMKRFRDMEQLSGGEKTVAALALLFAIHSYQPAPFFVLDEVDAALDNTNVAKIANYIKSQASDAFQFIVISLKGSLYERGDSLVGIFRDQEVNSSRTLTLDLTQYDE